MRSRVGTTRTRLGNVRSAVGTGTSGTVTQPTYATTFTTSLSPMSGQQGASASFVVTPGSGGFPGGKTVQPTVTGFSAPPAQTTTAGSTAALTFALTATGAGGTNAIVNVAIDGMTNQTGAEQFAISQPLVIAPSVFSGIAPRYDAVASAPVVAPSSTTAFSLYPHAGNWASSGSITATSSVSGDAVTTTAMAGGSGALTVTITTGSAPGERVLTFTNTGGLRNPAPRRLNVFAASSGTAATISAGSAPSNVYDQGGFSLEKWSGTWGWTAQGGATLLGGAFAQIAINPASPVTALFGRIHDGWSSGATTTAGTGTQISNVVQISGPRAAGAQSIYAHVPGVDTACYIDVSATSDMANAVRIPYRFTARDQWLDDSRSRECQTGGCYPYNGPPGSTAYCVYQGVTGTWNQNPGAPFVELQNGGFGRHDGSNSWGNNGMAFGGIGGSEIGRLFAIRKGFGLTMAGTQAAGGNLDDHWNSDGSAKTGMSLAFGALSNPRYLHINCSDMTGTNTLATQTTLLQNIVNWVHANWPSIAVIILDAGVSGQFGTNGSCTGVNSGPGYTRVQKWITDHIETVDPTIISADMGSDWNEYYTNSGHLTYRSTIRCAQKNALCALMAESTIASGFGFNQADRAATFPKTATLDAANGVIRITPVLPAGATALRAQSFPNGVLNGSFTYSDDAATAAQLVAVYQGANKTAEVLSGQGAYNYDASGAPLANVHVSSVSIDTNGDVLLHVPTSTTGPLTMNIEGDFYRNIGDQQNVCAIIHDGRNLGLGIGRGPGVRSQLDIAVS